MWGKAQIKNAYLVGFVVTAWPATFVAFLGSWAFAIWQFGWWLGLPLGWIPALIFAGVVGYVAGLLWPLLIVSAPLIWLFLRTRA